MYNNLMRTVVKHGRRGQPRLRDGHGIRQTHCASQGAERPCGHVLAARSIARLVNDV